MDSRVNRIILPVVAIFVLLLSGGTVLAQNTSSGSNLTAPSPAGNQPGQTIQNTAPPAGHLVVLPSVAPVVEKATPAVVNIFTVKTHRGGPRSRYSRPSPGPNAPRSPDNLFDDFFGFPQAPPQVYRERALGSGFIFDEEGYIITNNHVVEGADEIKVILENKQEIAAEIVGRDPKTDLALIKLTKAGKYPFLRLGDSEKVQIGDWLVAIGNPYGLEHTVTTGILSARGRAIGAGPYDDFLQTDASINPGNSGGPLLNLNGDVVGINTMIIAGGNGIGFAIPTKIAGKIIDQLKSKGQVERGWAGVVIQPVTNDMIKSFGVENTNGALVSDVMDDTPAKRAGIQHGDIIVEFDGQAIKEYGDLTAIVADTPVGKVVNVVVIRAKKRTTLKMTVARLEDDSQPPAGPEGANIDLGLTLREITPEMAQRWNVTEASGLFVEQVAPNSLADGAGIRVRDIILEINSVPVKTLQDFNTQMKNNSKEETVLIWLRRGERTLYCPVSLK
ncbi:MAG: Do family serine endopeptidase [Deltaproteobacteria bacterium]|jgi:serine protease Do|nr:Do family serine endopeptidase [Deltaproteobacteria bacterium]